MRGFGAAAGCARAVIDGIMASSSGRPTTTPAPRKNVRRERCFFVMNITTLLPFTIPGSRFSVRVQVQTVVIHTTVPGSSGRTVYKEPRTEREHEPGTENMEA